eukprot:15170285-Alexandrium_andersonii.AAC.1
MRGSVAKTVGELRSPWNLTESAQLKPHLRPHARIRIQAPAERWMRSSVAKLVRELRPPLESHG